MEKVKLGKSIVKYTIRCHLCGEDAATITVSPAEIVIQSFDGTTTS